MNLRSSESE